jgi:hypothetical protein
MAYEVLTQTHYFGGRRTVGLLRVEKCEITACLGESLDASQSSNGS